MIDLKLGADYDLELAGGDLALVSDGAEVAQAGGIALLTIEGEWYYDYTIGIPWLDGMFTVSTSYEEKAKILWDTIARINGVDTIAAFEFGVDPVAHKAVVTFEAVTTWGAVRIEAGA